MGHFDGVDLERRVLVLAPTGRDAANSRAVLSKAGLCCKVCHSIANMCGELSTGVGVIILTDEAIGLDKQGLLAGALADQPSWSDLPIIVLTRGGPESPVALQAMRALGNVILLERPIRVFTLTTATQTALRAREKQYQIRSQLEALRQADARKDEFIATLAHELRNPLAPIRTGLQILRAAGQLSGDSARTRDMMERQVGHMVRLIDDLMDVSRITRGKSKLRIERLDFREVLDTALETSRPLIDKARHHFTTSLPAGPLPLEGDPTRLAQIISNLLNNAAKYTPDGGIVDLSAAVDQASLTIRVRDNGVGIATEMLPRVFELFTQVGRSLERAQGGLGIGLTLVKRLVEMHRGEITAESEGAGKGCVFTVRLPLARESGNPRHYATRPSPAPSTMTKGLRVLVVDDNLDAAATLSKLLELSGHVTRFASDGATALETARAFEPDIALLDIGLPGMDGYELARTFRKDPTLSAVVLIALTGWGGQNDRRRSREAGFDFHLTKPAATCDIEKVFSQVSGQWAQSRKGYIMASCSDGCSK